MRPWAPMQKPPSGIIFSYVNSCAFPPIDFMSAADNEDWDKSGRYRLFNNDHETAVSMRVFDRFGSSILSERSANSR
jgi:hypothetical protein